MKRSHLVAGLVVVVLAVVVANAHGSAGAAVLLAANRCNGQTIGELSARIRDFDRHPPGGNQAALVKRYGALSETINTLNEEREILDSLCQNDAQEAELFSQIAAASALALVLEADVVARLNAACPIAATQLPTMMLADAWLTLAYVVNDQNGTVPASFSDDIAKIQTRAAAVNLTLPVWADTSVYWRDQVRAKGKAAIAAACPTPSQSPGASAGPSATPHTSAPRSLK